MTEADSTALHSLIERLVHATDDDEKRRLYAEWAARYDGDLDEFGYVAPGIALEQFERLVPDRSARIYDAGCGTGRVGALLAGHGYVELVGGDFSPEMRRLAEARGIYRELHHADYARSLDLPDASFDAVISVGVYSDGFRACFLEEMLRILRPRGVLLFTVRPVYWDREVEEDIGALVARGAVDVLSLESAPYMLAQGATAWYACLRRRA